VKKGIYAFLAVLTVFAIITTITSCPWAWEEAWVPIQELPKLPNLSIGEVDAELGTPNMRPEKVKPGSVTLYIEDTGGNPTLIATVDIIPPEVDDSITITWAVTPNAETYPDEDDFTDDAPATLENGEYLWIQANAGNVSAYYAIKVTVRFGIGITFAIKHSPASRELTLAEWNEAGPDVKILTVEMEQESPRYQYQWYENTTFSGTGGTAISGETNNSYAPSITENGDYFYYVTINYINETLTSIPVRIKISPSVTPADTQYTIGTTRRNYVRGIGGTGAFMFRTGDNADASPDADEKYIDLLFGELGANILRIMVQDDYLNYIQNTIQSRNSDKFFHNARDNFFAVIQKANKYGGYVFANPWTAPARMKERGGDKGNGGYLIQTGPNYVDYADHLRDFLKWLNANNAPIFALGILNEPDFGGGANYEGMGMTGQVTRDWFKTVGNFTTQRVANRANAGIISSIFERDIIPGYGGGKPTHHVLAMSGDVMGDIKTYMDPQLDDLVSNNNIELMGRHYYTVNTRYTKVAGTATTDWADRPQEFDSGGTYKGPYEAASLEKSPQMYAPGSKPGNIKREIWQTEHDFNFWSNSTTPPASNVQRYWNSAFATLNDIDWCLRVNGESVFDWWYSQSYSGLVTSYQEAGFPPYTITPRGRAFAHYARYVNETWLLPIASTRGSDLFNKTSSSFNAGAKDPKISAFEDVNGKFISVVMYTPTNSTAGSNGGSIGSGFGAGGTYGNDDPTAGSTNVGRIEVVMPSGFIASSASAIRTYGNDNATSADESWTAANPVPAGSPRYWIDEPVFLSRTSDGKSVVEVTLPAGNVISIMVKGEWTGTQATTRYFEERKRPYTVK